ncbi:N-acetyl-gamma-glutamyl-phosphate reductase [Pendulispora albinea]|uniref:N-acetyl-gamma-glutamyl-phosphate reductase n=1 Tax=Pendulispora albinea TaxID=2741071 RepID=A0ABZ2LR58_9BACT
MAKRFKAAIIGGSGYGGAELIRRLLRHPEVELVRVASVDFVGEPITVAHPNLEGQTDLRFEGITPAEAAKGMDVVLLGLPHRVSAQKMPELVESGARVVDLSGDFRLRDKEVYRRYYGAEHPCPRLLAGTFVYGLPEIHREAIRAARYVASPGCFATTIELALLPLARKGWLKGEVEVVGITGSSGSGVVPSVGTHHPVRANNLKTYKPLDHQHIPEIVQTLGDAGAKDVALRFVPVSAPLSRGIFATSFAHVDERISPEQIKAAYLETFANEPFVRVPAKRLPEVAAVKGTNYAEVSAVPGEVHDGKRVVACFSATDNLIKGGAGQAIQSMNLILGLDERLTLEDPGGWP